MSVPDVAFSGVSTVIWEEPPVNDLFADAIVIDDLPYEGHPDTYLASTEDGEVDLCGYYIESTVWYRYTAPADGMLNLGVQGATGSVFTGDSIDSLESVFCSLGGQQYFFEVEAGTDYYIRVEAYLFGEQGPDITLTLDTISGISVGDMNCDGSADAVDALIIRRLSAGVPAPDCATAYGDVNCDGYVTIFDTLVLLGMDRTLTRIRRCLGAR